MAICKGVSPKSLMYADSSAPASIKSLAKASHLLLFPKYAIVCKGVQPFALCVNIRARYYKGKSSITLPCFYRQMQGHITIIELCVNICPF